MSSSALVCASLGQRSTTTAAAAATNSAVSSFDRDKVMLVTRRFNLAGAQIRSVRRPAVAQFHWRRYSPSFPSENHDESTTERRPSPGEPTWPARPPRPTAATGRHPGAPPERGDV